MAAIEKICEYSGDYPGWKMWEYKRNHIQICPEHRKAFKGAKHVLVIAKSEKRIVYNGGGTSEIDSDVVYCYNSYRVVNRLWKGPGYYRWSGHHHSTFELLKKFRVEQEYIYDLYCPELLGNVEGHYINYSTNISAVKRRLKRMMGKDLNIVILEDYDPKIYQNIRRFAEGFIGD